MADHADVHPEPEEGSRECVNTPRAPRFRSIDDLLFRLRIKSTYDEHDLARSRERLERRLAEGFPRIENGAGKLEDED